MGNDVKRPAADPDARERARIDAAGKLRVAAVGFVDNGAMGAEDDLLLAALEYARSCGYTPPPPGGVMRVFHVRCGTFDEEVAFWRNSWEDAEAALKEWIAGEPSLAGATWERVS